MTSTPSLVALVDKESGYLIEILDKNDSCVPYAGGDYQGHCGGCGACLLMQIDADGIELQPISENFRDWNLKMFAEGLYAAFGDRVFEMSDDLYIQLRRLWDTGVEYGRHGVPPIPEPDDAEDVRGALQQVLERKARNT